MPPNRLNFWRAHAPTMFRVAGQCMQRCKLWYGEPNAISNVVGYAKFYRRSHVVVIRVFDEAGNLIGTHEHAGEFVALDE